MFVVPESGASKPQNRFAFEADGKKYSVPLLGFVSGPASLLFEEGEEMKGAMASFDDDDARDAYASLTRDQRTAFHTAWSAASQVSPGESQSSAAS